MPPVVRLLVGTWIVLESADSQSSRTKDMTWLQPVEVADMESVEAAWRRRWS
jgi:hypothetical protein